MILLFVVLAAVAVGFVVGWLLVRFERLHARLSYDAADSGPQKFHATPTPRIGGIPVASGVLAGLGTATALGAVDAWFFGALCIAALPAFASGLLEDITKKLGPDMRLWASFLSALVAILLFDAVVERSGIPGIDALLAWYPLALVFTMVGVGGVAHALNIIDGYNGLAGVVTVMMHAAFGIVAWQVGDVELAATSAAFAGATVGFLCWNYPRGRIFAGDGGAYLWGVSVALVGILLTHRHPTISPWFPLLVMIYPVFETLFSIYRRKFRHASAAGQPDAKHLHQLIYRRLLARQRPGHAPTADGKTRRNAATSPFLWGLAACAIVPATWFWNDTAALIALSLTFCLIYVWLYRAIVRFAVPRWLWRIARRAAAAAFGDHARESA